MTQIFLSIILGIIAGSVSGIFGIGGGIIIVPALVLLFGFTQQQAQGTTMALLIPPIGILAAYVYYKNGLVDIKVATFVCLGFILGSYLGSKVAVNVPNEILQKMFGTLLIAVGIYMIIKK